MGRLRARMSKSSVDKAVQEKVAQAHRLLQESVRLCRVARHQGGVEAARSHRVERDLSRALSALGNVRRLTPLYDTDDPDHMDEEERNRRYREKRAQMVAEEVAGEGLYITPDEEV